MPATYTLDNAVETHREFPTTFPIPSQYDRETLRRGDLVKLIFRIEVGDEVHVERMWVIVSEVRPETYQGILDNDPYCTTDLRAGMPVDFHADHVIRIDRSGS